MKSKKKQAAPDAVTNLGRQGDVLLRRADNIPDAELVPEKGLVLAQGESSGHHHQLYGKGCKLYRFRDTNRVGLVVDVGPSGGEVRVVGGEVAGTPRHRPISLAPGRYWVPTQRQYTAEDERRSRAVAD